MITTNFVFDWRRRIKGNEIGPVDLRITCNRESIYIGTGVRVRRSEFKNGEITGHKDADELNRQLETFRKWAVKAATEMDEENIAVSGAELKLRIKRLQTGERKSDTDMLEWFTEQTKMLGLGEGTIKHYQTLLDRLKQFGELTAWKDLSIENIYKFDAWLHTLKAPLSNAQKKAGEKEKTISDGGVYNYHKCLKALLNRAVLFEIIDRNPYDKLRGKFKRGDKERVEFLTKEEMDAIESIRPVKGTQMAVIRDLFVFQLHTGLSYADTQVFDFSEYTNVDGHWQNIGKRVKTGIEYMVELTPECERILKQYRWSLPKISNAEYNLGLKTLAEAAGIRKRLHSHLARHSFATYATANGIAIQDVAKALGHASIVQTQRYAKVQPEKVFKKWFNHI